MKNLLNLLSCLPVLLLFTLKSSAQLYKVELDQKVKKASLILEGKVIDTKSFWNKEHTMIYTANTIEVYKLFKGTFTEKTIEVVTDGGSVDNFYIEASDLLRLDKGQTGIFFCQQASIPIKSPNTNRVLLDIYSSDQGFLRYDMNSNVAYAPFAKYEEIEKNLYKLLVEKVGHGMKVIDNNFKITPTRSIGNIDGVVGGLAGSISSFSPSTVYGGALNDVTHNQLTINGSGFGAVPSGSCAVWFTSGSPTQTSDIFPVKYNSSYIVSWSDTKIVIKVPDKAATGKIIVVTSSGSSISSGTDLNVFYSVMNGGFKGLPGSPYDTTWSEARLLNNNGSGGYTIFYSTGTLGSGKNFDTSPEKATFQRALNTWKELVGANILEGGTTSVQAVSSSDNKNVVMFDNKLSGVKPLQDGTLATTYSYFSVCYDQSPFKIYTTQKVGFDVVVRNAGVSVGNVAFTIGPCFPANNEYDLETVVLHELGHAINLQHINDSYEGTGIPYLNPSKLMNYAILNYVSRKSPDASAYQCALYTCKKMNYDYGCSGVLEMTPLSTTIASNDECPASFPATATTSGTTITFDLVHSTSNKTKDPQSDKVNCQNTITNVTNNAYYALKTSTTASGTLKLTVSQYTTNPSTQSACSGQGVRMALYEVSSCPTGQAFPAPVKCLSFTADGPLADITGLKANTNYLMYFDGIRNTKASFKITINGSALPITLQKFYGEYIKGMNKLYIDIVEALNVKSISVEKSATGNGFTAIGDVAFTSTNFLGMHTYNDAQPFAGNNYYRLAIRNNDGSVQYSQVILLKNDAGRLAYIFPNPVKDVLNISITSKNSGRYSCYIYDISGKLLKASVFEAAEGAQLVTLPFANMSKGAYVVKITDDSNEVVLRQKLIKP